MGQASRPAGVHHLLGLAGEFLKAGRLRQEMDNGDIGIRPIAPAFGISILNIDRDLDAAVTASAKSSIGIRMVRYNRAAIMGRWMAQEEPGDATRPPGSDDRSLIVPDLTTSAACLRYP